MVTTYATEGQSADPECSLVEEKGWYGTRAVGFQANCEC